MQPVPMGSPLSYYGVYQDCKVISGMHCLLGSARALSGTGTLVVAGLLRRDRGPGQRTASTGDAFATATTPRPTPNSRSTIRDGYDYHRRGQPGNGGEVWHLRPDVLRDDVGPGRRPPRRGRPLAQLGRCQRPCRLRSTSGSGTPRARFTTAVTMSLVTRLGVTCSRTSTRSTPAPAYATAADCSRRQRQRLRRRHRTGHERDGGAGRLRLGRSPTRRSAATAQPLVADARRAFPAGTYRLQVTTTDPANATRQRRPKCSRTCGRSEVVAAAGSPTDLTVPGGWSPTPISASGQQVFFLAQVDPPLGCRQDHADRSLRPGRRRHQAWLQILSPDGNVYTPGRVRLWTADGNATAGHQVRHTRQRASRRTRSGSGINPPAGGIRLRATLHDRQPVLPELLDPDPRSRSARTYGAAGPDADRPGESAQRGRLVEDPVHRQQRDDTTTWMVSLRGNPVHLVR